MMMMKTSIAVVTCLLLCSPLLLVEAQSNAGPAECCFNFYSKQLPVKKIARYEYTDNRCTTEAIIFTMESGRRFCVRSTKQWVQDFIETKVWDSASVLA